jgi:quercetin dioxygenase-like cupin family protein
MTFINLEDLAEKEVVPGYRARFIHSEHMTLAYWRVEAEAALPEHAHPHEQVTTVLEGDFELNVAGERRLLKPGMAAVVPSNVKHRGKALTACRLIDAFYPVREEYRRK